MKLKITAICEIDPDGHLGGLVFKASSVRKGPVLRPTILDHLHSQMVRGMFDATFDMKRFRDEQALAAKKGGRG